MNDRRRLSGYTAAFIALHVYHARIQGGGGWNRRHNGLGGAIWAFIRLNLNDPVLSAGMSDFTVLAIIYAAEAIHQLEPGKRNSLKVKLWLMIFTLFPGLGALLYRLWLNPVRSG